MDSRSRDVMTVPELCDYLQMSEAKVREMLRQGTIPAVLIGRQWRIRRSSIERWLAEQEQAAKVVTQYGGPRPGTDRLGQALSYQPEDLPLPKPPRPSHTVEEADPGARKPRPAGAPDRKSGSVRRK
jgi:excisionase family DNA binding protein